MQKAILLLPLTLLTLSATAQQKSAPDYKRLVKKHWSAATKKILQQQTAHNKTTAAKQRLTARALYAFDGSAMQLNDSANYVYSSDRGSVFNLTDMFYNDYEGSTEMQFDSSAHYRLSGPDFGLTDGSKITYNSSNVRQSYTTLSSTPPGSPLKEIADNRYTYNSNGTLNTTYSLQLNGSVWDTTGKTTYSYNAQNKVAEELVYDKIATGWEETFKTAYTYDGAGNNTEVMGYEWTGSGWAENWKDSNTYNANNKLSTNTYMEYTGGVWESVYADSFGYSSTDYYTYNMSKEWNTDSVKWLYSSLEERHVGANGLPDSVYYSQWDEDSQDWMRIMISDWHYNSNDLPTNANGIISFMGAELPVFQFNYYYEYYFGAGVGQYQHDVNQVRLKERLDQTVVSCVNLVGVNLNTASKHLLSYVSGIGPSIAENIVQYRSEIGGFTSRKQLLKVPRLGSKAFEQCAGFLRIKNGEDPLDASAVHPEAYSVVAKMATDLGLDIAKLIGNEEAVKQLDTKKYISETVGEHTIKDILNELKKPGLDPRSEAQVFEFANIYSIEDVTVGMVVPGVVTNLTRFGAFVDIGVKQDGLVHVSEISHNYITDPGEALKLNDKVNVKVLEVDMGRKRIALSIKQTLEAPARRDRPQQHKRQEQSREKDTSNMNMNDALSLLKKKFGK